MDTKMKIVLPARIYVVPIIAKDGDEDEIMWSQAAPLTKDNLDDLGYRHRADLNLAMREYLNACAGVKSGAGFGNDTGPYTLLRLFIQSIIDRDPINSRAFGPDAEDSEVFPAFKKFMDRGRDDD